MTGDPPAVQVWQVDLDVDAAAVASALALLSSNERARADRLRRSEDRGRFVVSRAALRRILGDCLGVAPKGLSLAEGDFGKPYLAMTGAPQFNLSHSGDLALIAVCRDLAVGVDIEQTGRGLGELDAIVSGYFSTAERLAYAALPRSERARAFYRGWTRKEAVAKALGLGMSLPGPSFDVTLTAEPSLLRLGGETAPMPWSLIDLDLRTGYSGALAAAASGVSLSMRLYEGAWAAGRAGAQSPDRRN
jgi:4'-phosphopantetheinyl transferase